MDTEEILEGLRIKIKGTEPEENIEERAEEIRKRLEKEVKKGHYAELKKVGADLEAVAHILAYTENEALFVKKVLKKTKLFKNDPTLGKRLEKNRMKRFVLERSGKDLSFKELPKEERIRKQKELIETLRKYPEYYLDKAILDLGSYFEAISLPGVSQVEERRQYRLIAKLLYDFDLFKQSFSKAEEKDEEDSTAYERVIKRAESIPARVWKEHLQGEMERI